MTSEGVGNGVMCSCNLSLGENYLFVKAAMPDCVYAQGTFIGTGVVLCCEKLIEEKGLMKLLCSLQNKSSPLSPGFSF